MVLFTLFAIFLSLVTFLKVNQLESKIKKHFGEDTEPDLSIQEKKPDNSEETPRQKLGKSSLDFFISWFSHEWPLKTGALFILLGFVWLVSYAFLNNWIGPVGRISFGLITGSLILYAGSFRVKTVKSQGITLIGLGAAVITVTVASAQLIYHMFPSVIALVLIFVTSALTASISLRQNILSLAVLSLIIGNIAPLLLGTTDKNIFGLYTYLLAVTVGSIWISVYSKWKILTWISMVIVALYSLGYFFSTTVQLSAQLTPTELFQLKFFALTFTSLFFFNTLAALLTNNNPSKIDFYNAVAVGFFTFGWINGLVRPEYKSLIAIIAALSYAGASYIVFIKTKIKNAVLIYTTVALILLAVATGYEFNGPLLVIAFSVQALVLPIFAIRLLGIELGKHFFLYFVLPFLFSINSVIDYSNFRPESLTDIYTLIAVTVAFFMSGVYFYEKNKNNDKPLHNISVFLIVIGSIYGLILIWRTASITFLEVYYARMLSLLIYTLIGLFTYISGEFKKRVIMYKFGLGVLIFVILRLLIVEVWDMELTVRIITFFLIGLLFAGSVLLRRQAKSV